jgi:hypothetical protein
MPTPESQPQMRRIDDREQRERPGNLKLDEIRMRVGHGEARRKIEVAYRHLKASERAVLAGVDENPQPDRQRYRNQPETHVARQHAGKTYRQRKSYLRDAFGAASIERPQGTCHIRHRHAAALL